MPNLSSSRAECCRRESPSPGLPAENAILTIATIGQVQGRTLKQPLLKNKTEDVKRGKTPNPLYAKRSGVDPTK